MADLSRAVQGGYGPRYGPFSQYAPEVLAAWDDPAEESGRFGLWLPPGHAYPVLPSDAAALAAVVPAPDPTDYAEEKTA